MSKAAANTGGGSRVQSVDLLRGLILLLVALDILRYFIFNGFSEPTNLEGTTAPLFFTRWITHFFAPAYLLLAGVGAFFKGRGLDKKALSRFLVTRGVFIILLEIVVVGFLWTFQFNLFPIFLQFVWVLGASMIVLAGLIWLPLAAIAGISLAVIFGHNLLDGLSFGPGWWANVLDGIFHKEAVICADLCKRTPGEVYYAFISYPIIPWAAVMGLGYSLGSLYSMDGARRKKLLLLGGLVATVIFFVVRGINGYGSPWHWKVYDESLWTVMSFLNTEKYPPSVSYLAMTIGPLLILLALFENVTGRITGFFQTFGRAPLFFYIIQFLLAHIVALILGVGQGYAVEEFMRPFWNFPDGFGVSLPWVYVALLAEVAVMYPLCEWYAELRAKKGHKFLQYF